VSSNGISIDLREAARRAPELLRARYPLRASPLTQSALARSRSPTRGQRRAETVWTPRGQVNASGGTLMSIIGWIVLGLIAGFIGSKIVNSQGQGLLLDIVLGIVGAVVGGLIFSAFGATGITGFDIWSLIVAIAGSVVVLWVYHAFTGRRTV
jgi:uncharacterized membrane protein YeaQ/YmgE (transglycosylase-associated protein family)